MPQINSSVILALGLISTGTVRAGVSFTGLGHPPGTSLSSVATGVSESGEFVVGSTGDIEERPFIWSRATGMRELTGLPAGVIGAGADAISSDGSVIMGHATMEGSSSNAFRWTADGEFELLGFLHAGAIQLTLPWAMSGDGSVIVGIAQSIFPLSLEAFRWNSAEGITGLGSMIPGGFSTAVGVSADGRIIAGTSDSFATDFNIEAYIWTEATGMIGLGAAPGAGHSQAFGISGDGRVVIGFGYEWLPGETRLHGFTWSAEGGMRAIPEPDGYTSSPPTAISADGSIIVGNITSRELTEPFVFERGSSMRLLTDVLREGDATGFEGWTMMIPNDVSADGRTIVGAGTNPDGNHEAWVAVIPAPGTGILFAIVGVTARRRRSRKNHGVRS